MYHYVGHFLSICLFLEIPYCLIFKSWYHLILGESVSGHNSLWRLEFHYLCWGTRAWSNTDTAAPQTAPSDETKMERREKTKALDKRVRSTHLIWRQKDFQCWYLRQCSSLAAFHWQERRQQCKQVPAREVMTANKRWREIYIQPINIHHRQNTVGTNFLVTTLTCGKLWVSSVWLEFLQFSPCQKTNCHPATEKQEIISHLVR